MVDVVLASGEIQIGEPTALSSSTIITSDGGIITAEIKGRVSIVGDGNKSFDLSITGPNSVLIGITIGLSFVWLRGTDASGNLFPFGIEWNSTNSIRNINDCTEFLWSVKVVTEVVSPIIIYNNSKPVGNVLTLEYVFAGQ